MTRGGTSLQGADNDDGYVLSRSATQIFERLPHFRVAGRTASISERKKLSVKIDVNKGRKKKLDVIDAL
jgi:hypothetical protein